MLLPDAQIFRKRENDCMAGNGHGYGGKKLRLTAVRSCRSHARAQHQCRAAFALCVQVRALRCQLPPATVKSRLKGLICSCKLPEFQYHRHGENKAALWAAMLSTVPDAGQSRLQYTQPNHTKEKLRPWES